MPGLLDIRGCKMHLVVLQLFFNYLPQSFHGRFHFRVKTCFQGDHALVQFFLCVFQPLRFKCLPCSFGPFFSIGSGLPLLVNSQVFSNLYREGLVDIARQQHYVLCRGAPGQKTLLISRVTSPPVAPALRFAASEFPTRN